MISLAFELNKKYHERYTRLALRSVPSSHGARVNVLFFPIGSPRRPPPILFVVSVGCVTTQCFAFLAFFPVKQSASHRWHSFWRHTMVFLFLGRPTFSHRYNRYVFGLWPHAIVFCLFVFRGALFSLFGQFVSSYHGVLFGWEANFSATAITGMCSFRGLRPLCFVFR